MLFRKMQRHASAALKLLAVCIILRRACLAQRHTSLRSASTSASSSTTQTVLNDIRNAFKVITNNTSLLNRLIPVMYQPAMQKANPVFLFKIPTELSSTDAPSKSAGNMEDTASGYWMWSMQRSDFTEPTFPNLTVQHMRAQLKILRRQHNMTKPGMPDFNVREQQTTETDGKEEPGQHDDWSLLGLDGWSGAISPPADTFDFTHKPSVDSTYPIADILMDFGKTVDPPSQGADASAESNGGAVGVTKVLQNVKANDADIYLARVNDPFGYSVKWELRNTSSPSGSDDRTKRDVVKLYSMIQCSTGCNPLTYKGYGCFCGFLGAGLPVDDIDRCCKLHDKCYEHSNCISYLEYFVPYVWKCYRGKPVCAIDHGEWGGPDSCAARLCYCDLRLSRCLRQFVCPRRRAVCTSSTARRLQNLLLTF